jgi:hypothetical protein
VSIPLPFEDALRGLMKVDPEQIDVSAKDATLKRIREAPDEERAIPGRLAKLREYELRAGATEQEIKETEDLPRLRPGDSLT